VTTPVQLVSARLYDVLCYARGADGLLGDEALACAIPEKRFRRSTVALNDPALSRSAMDRAVRLGGWIPLSGGVGPNDSLYNWREQIWQVDLSIGYAIGVAKEDLAHVVDDESASDSVVEWEIRAAEDQRLIERALCSQPLIGGLLDADGQRIIVVRVVSPPRTDIFGGGTAQRVQPITVHAWIKH